MRVKSVIDLLALSSQLYMLSKDEELRQNLQDMVQKGKQKLNDLAEGISGSPEEGDENAVERLMQKAREARAQLEARMAEVAEKVYHQLRITHQNETNRLSGELDRLKRELALAEARILHLEQAAKISPVR